MAIERFLGIDTQRGNLISIGTSIDANLGTKGVLLGADRDICFEEESSSSLYTLINSLGWLDDVEV